MTKLSFSELQERSATTETTVLLNSISGGLSDACHDTSSSNYLSGDELFGCGCAMGEFCERCDDIDIE